jgi:hypothetical protein
MTCAPKKTKKGCYLNLDHGRGRIAAPRGQLRQKIAVLTQMTLKPRDQRCIIDKYLAITEDDGPKSHLIDFLPRQTPDRSLLLWSKVPLIALSQAPCFEAVK